MNITTEDEMNTLLSNEFDGQDLIPTEEDELRKAARAGILLLEKNHEYQEENSALRIQLQVLEQELQTERTKMALQIRENDKLRHERQQNLIEVNELQNELQTCRKMITTFENKEIQRRSNVDQLMLEKQQLQEQLKQISIGQIEQRRQSEDEEQNEKSVVNPAASYDSNQTTVFTLADYENLLQRYQLTSDENINLDIEIKSLRKEIESLRQKHGYCMNLNTKIESLETEMETLKDSNQLLQADLEEQTQYAQSVQTMNATLRQIVNARSFSLECICPVHPLNPESNDRTGNVVSVREIMLADDNKNKDREIEALKKKLTQLDDGIELNQSDDQPQDNSSPLIENYSSVTSEIETTASDSGSMGRNGVIDEANDGLVKRNLDLQEKLKVKDDILKRMKEQLVAAFSSQKALEECHRVAQEELATMTKALDYHMANQSDQNLQENMVNEDRWIEDTTPFPAPLGDLNSPLIKCLLNHWTSDKSKIMVLTDWMHHAIRGTGKSSPLRLDLLSSEVTAGFTQLLVPIMRERYQVGIKVFRRDCPVVLSDLILEAIPPTNSNDVSSPSSDTLRILRDIEQQTAFD